MFLEGPMEQSINFSALRYLTGECNYGGRVTDTWDRRTLMSILNNYYTSDVDPGYKLSTSGTYVIPPVSSWQEYLDFIAELPINTKPEVFGLHDNADITKDQNETALILDAILSTEGQGSGGGGGNKDALLDELAAGILDKLPERFDIETIQEKYPVLYEESMNTILVQECGRYNKLTDCVRSGLKDLRKAIVGEVVMSQELEAMSNDVFNGKVPGMWGKVSYPSLKPLGSYVADLLERLKSLVDWIDNGQPVVSWISGIFFTQSFFTGLLQNFARKHQLPIDHIVFDFEYLFKSDEDRPTERAEDGTYIDGLFLEGARWNYDTHELADSLPKQLFTKAPIIWIRPCTDKSLKSYPHYVCPVYRTGERRGTLSTTGHSTNFVMALKIPSSLSQDVWIQRGVAMITQLSD
jgi:dynein heavy chain